MEKINKKKHRHFILLFFVWGCLFFLIWAASRDYSPPVEKMSYGISFSEKFARNSLGLDWKKAYIDILDELKVKKIRLMSYWDEIEKEKDTLNFENLDFMMDEAAKRNAKVILVVGLRQPRWPECHLPIWWAERSGNTYQPYITRLIEEIVNRYKSHTALEAWQIENEPFLNFFGKCEPTDPAFLKTEIELVKTLDPNHQIHITASGEFTSWSKTFQYGDYLGVSLYRVIEKKFIGKIYYPLFPAFYNWRAKLAKLNAKNEKIYLSEVQLEPWKIKQLTEVPIAEQLEQFNEKSFVEQIRFARATGFETQYLWGAEWWYWLKTQGNKEIWNLAKELFKNGYL